MSYNQCPYKSGRSCHGCIANIAIRVTIFGQERVINCARVVSEMVNAEAEKLKATALMGIDIKLIENLIRKAVGDI